MNQLQVQNSILSAPPFQPETPDISILNMNRRRPPEFPSQVLRSFWREWALREADGAGAPLDYVMAGLLAAAAALIGHSRITSPWARWREPAILWMGLVGDPSSGKSPALDPVMDIVHQIERDLAKGYELKVFKWKQTAEIARAIEKEWKRAVKTARKEGADAPPCPDNARIPPEPTFPRLKVADATVEALARLLTENPRGLLYQRDEIAGWIGSMDKYGGAGGDRALWIEAYGGRPYVVDRVKFEGKPLRIERLGVSVLGGVQPDKLNKMFLSGDDDGMPARFLWVWPNKVPPSRPHDVANRDEAVAALKRLSMLEMQLDGGQSASPVCVFLSPTAADIFQEWRLRHHGREAAGMLGSAVGKADGQVLRLALILEHLWWCAEAHSSAPSLVSDEAVSAAIQLMDNYFLPMAERVYGDAALPKRERDAATLAKWVVRLRPDVVNARVLRREAKLPGMREASAVHAAIEVLVDAGWLIPDPGGESDRGGRSRADYRVSPALWTVLDLTDLGASH